MSMQIKKPKFITIEGIEGVGKSTCLNYIADFLHQQEIMHIKTREPGGTEIAEKIRKIMLEHHSETMCSDTELLLVFAGRIQHLAKVIYPALENGMWVLCDRFNDATFAYQGGGRGIDLQRIEKIKQWLYGDFEPDLTLLLYAPITVALKRAKGRGQLDRIEVEEEKFFQSVQNTYLMLAKKYPNRFRCVDATKPLKQIRCAINAIMTDFLANE